MIESIHKLLHEWFGIPVLFSSIGKKIKISVMSITFLQQIIVTKL